jgi:hypothetical protein
MAARWRPTLTVAVAVAVAVDGVADEVVARMDSPKRPIP